MRSSANQDNDQRLITSTDDSQFTWLWWWLMLRLSKRQSMSPQTVLLRTTLTQTITIYRIMIWLLGSNHLHSAWNSFTAKLFRPRCHASRQPTNLCCGHETTRWIFLPRFSFFFIPFVNTEVVILFYFRELLYERRIDGTSEQMSSSSGSDSRVRYILKKIRFLRCLHKHPIYHFFGFASKRACFWPSFDVFDFVGPK